MGSLSNTSGFKTRHCVLVGTIFSWSEGEGTESLGSCDVTGAVVRADSGYFALAQMGRAVVDCARASPAADSIFAATGGLHFARLRPSFNRVQNKERTIYRPDACTPCVFHARTHAQCDGKAMHAGGSDLDAPPAMLLFKLTPAKGAQVLICLLPCSNGAHRCWVGRHGLHHNRLRRALWPHLRVALSFSYTLCACVCLSLHQRT